MWENIEIQTLKNRSWLLHVLYMINGGTVNDVLEHIHEQKDWKYTTVLTVLQRMEYKGYVEVDRSSKQYIFKPIQSPDEYLETVLQENLGNFILHYPDALVKYLVKLKKLSKQKESLLRQVLKDELRIKKS